MTVNEKIIQALKPFGIPVVADFSGGGEKEYITFNYASDEAALSGDDGPMEVVASMQIHYFLPMDRDYLSIKKKIRKALFSAGFTYPSVEHLTEPEGNIRHLVFECETENDDELEY